MRCSRNWLIYSVVAAVLHLMTSRLASPRPKTQNPTTLAHSSWTSITLPTVERIHRLSRHKTSQANILYTHRVRCQSLSLKKIPIASSSFPSSIKTFGRCIKTRWLASGPSMRSTSAKTLKTGRGSLQMNNISSSTSSLFLQPLTVLFSKILPNVSALKFRFPKPDASTASR
jgi:hypothetical protein